MCIFILFSIIDLTHLLNQMIKLILFNFGNNETCFHWNKFTLKEKSYKMIHINIFANDNSIVIRSVSRLLLQLIKQFFVTCHSLITLVFQFDRCKSTKLFAFQKMLLGYLHFCYLCVHSFPCIECKKT